MAARVEGIEFEIVGGSNSASNSVQNLSEQLIKLRVQVSASASSTTRLTNNLQTAGSSAEKTASAMQNIRSALKRVGSVASHVGSALKKIGSFALRINPLAAGFRSAAKAAGGFASKLGTVISSFKRILFYRMIRSVIRMITQAFKEGITNLYNWSNALGGEFAASMDRAATATLYLKNSLAAMAAPLINALVPVLDYVIDKIVDLLNWLNQLFAKLTGATYWTRAIRQATTWGEAASDAIGGTGSAAKEALRYLAPFDEINKFPEQSGSGGGAGGGSGGNGTDYSGMFETVPLENAFEGLDNFLSRVREIGDVIREAWGNSDVLASFQRALNSVKTLVSDIGDSFYRVFTGGYGYSWLDSVFDLVSSINDMVASIADSFDQAWNNDGNGDAFFQSIFTSLTNINRLARTFVDTFTDAWNSEGRGVTFFTNLINIATNLNNIIGNIADGIRQAWSQHGEQIWENILNIANTILGTINKITAKTEEWADDLDWNGLMTSIEDLTGAFDDLSRVLCDDFAWAWNNLLLPFAKWAIEKGAPETLELLASALQSIAYIAENNQADFELLGRLVERFLNNIRSAYDFVVALFKFPLDHPEVINALFGTFEDWGTLLEKHKEKTGGLASDYKRWFDEIIDYFKRKIPEFIEFIKPFFDVDNYVEYFQRNAAKLRNMFAGVWNSVVDSISDTRFGELIEDAIWGFTWEDLKIPIVPVVEEVDDEIPDDDRRLEGFWAFFDKYKDLIPDGDKKTSGFWAIFGSVIDKIPPTDKIIPGMTAETQTISDRIPTKDKNIKTTAEYTWYKDNLGEARKTIKTTANYSWYKDSLGEARKTIKTTADYSWFKDSLGENRKTIKTTADYTKSKDGLSDEARKLKSTAYMVKVIDALTADQRRITMAAKIVPGWSGSLASALGIEKITSTLSLKTPKVHVNWNEFKWMNTKYWYPKSFYTTYYAKGGIMNAATLLGISGNTAHIAGEAGAEAILPLENHTEWMDMVADRVATRIGGEDGKNVTVQVVLDGRVLAETTENIWRDDVRNGRYPLAGLA